MLQLFSFKSKTCQFRKHATAMARWRARNLSKDLVADLSRRIMRDEVLKNSFKD